MRDYPLRIRLRLLFRRRPYGGRRSSEWDRARKTRTLDSSLLFDANGSVDIPRVVDLLKGRSTRRVLMRE
ncbi:MAG: hypothetical protein DMF94_08395 [Acidobacteria bacterium]|nr:MAG: hypothetical protein DMF94_08395 [Acidobacteriota bacterium]